MMFISIRNIWSHGIVDINTINGIDELVVACVANHGRRNLTPVNQKFSGLLTRSRAKEKEGK